MPPPGPISSFRFTSTCVRLDCIGVYHRESRSQQVHTWGSIGLAIKPVNNSPLVFPFLLFFFFSPQPPLPLLRERCKVPGIGAFVWAPYNLHLRSSRTRRVNRNGAHIGSGSSGHFGLGDYTLGPIFSFSLPFNETHASEGLGRGIEA